MKNKFPYQGIAFALVVIILAASAIISDYRPAIRFLDESAASECVVLSSGQALIDINRAEPDLLRTLPGIGEVLAERIIAYREENGGFENTSDIINVRGIGEATYAAISPFICAVPQSP